ncbi:MAG TPA: hypothetical protein VHB21_18550 [Minicystis sp.]|nr:hypothetical protein [Minicystis sp.]
MRSLAAPCAAAIAAASSACGGNAEPPPRPPVVVALPDGKAPVLDLAADFLDTACKAPAGDAFARAWIAHEDRFWDVYAAYYRDAGPRGERARLAGDLALRRDEMCGHARAFRLVAPGLLDALRPEVARLVGAQPRHDVVFTAALQWTDGKVADVRGRPALLLNARHEAFARVDNLALVVAHELFHDAQESLYGERDRRLAPAARSLYREGAAVFGTTMLFPELGDRALEFSPKQLDRARFSLANAAAGLREAIRTRQDGAALDRWVRGGAADADLPPRMAYYVGLEIFRAIARERGDVAAARTSPEAFGAEVDRRLAEIAQH